MRSGMSFSRGCAVSWTRGNFHNNTTDEMSIQTDNRGEALRAELNALSRALQVLNNDNRRLPLSVYRVMVALAAAGEPCCAYAVARRAGFLLEQGRVKLHEAKRWGVVTNEKCAGQGVLWVLTEDGERELRRVQVAMRDGVDPDAVPVKKVRKPRKRSRGDE